MLNWKFFLGLVVSLVLFALAACGGGATPAPAPAPAQGDAAQGAALFVSLQCNRCHGDTAQGGTFPGRDDVIVPKIGANARTFEDFTKQIRTPKQYMPPVNESKVSDSQLRDIYAWITSLGQ
ncbi:MAG: cytochrome c [Dehalococcoidia bacterium]